MQIALLDLYHKSLGYLTGLTSLALDDNHLTESIPATLGKLLYLTELLLSNNLLNGTVPAEIGSLINLNFLDLRDNSFTGVITEEHFANLRSLQYVDLSSNNSKIVLNSDWRPRFTRKYLENFLK